MATTRKITAIRERVKRTARIVDSQTEPQDTELVGGQPPPASRPAKRRGSSTSAGLGKPGKAQAAVPAQDEMQDEDASEVGAPGEEELGGNTMTGVREYFGGVRWAWKDYIPVGHVTMIAGPQSVGKSYMAAHLIAVMTGAVASWPDGSRFEGDPGRVLLIETEEMRGEYVTRMSRLGVRDDMVIFPGADPTYLVNLRSDLERIQKLALKYDCKAIVVDSLSGGHFVEENSNEMRCVLLGLVALATNLQVPVIVVHHARKTHPLENARITLDRVRGSSTITQFCRSVIGVYRLVDDASAPVRVEILKASFCKPAAPFGLSVTSQGLVFGPAPEEEKQKTVLDYASEFLMEELKDGGVPFGDLMNKAKEEGITKDTLYRAKRRLTAVSDKGVWRLRTIDGESFPSPTILKGEGG